VSVDLRSRSRQHQNGSTNVGHDPLEEIQEVDLGPVDVLDQDDSGPLRRKLVDEGDDGLVESLACIERMQLTSDVEPECQSEDLTALERPQGFVL
jgi:hypothetical protein